tara:strand:+ start:179 stop:1174 length:996 start_codon:yes stop_codon:yes gene_type:complete
MGFIMKGSPAQRGSISGTEGHASALKKLAEEKASALKHKGGDSYAHHANLTGDSDHYAWNDPKNKDQKGGNETKKEKNKRKYGSEDPYGDAAKKDPNLGDYVAKRKTLEKGSDEWKRNQNKINEAYGVSKRYEVADANPKVDKISKSQDNVKAKGEEKKTKIQTKADTRIAEVDENVDRKVTRKDVRKARKEHGRGSQEVKEAKVGREKSRLTDLEGGKGGKKAKFLGNIRRKLSKKRLEKKERRANEGRTSGEVATAEKSTLSVKKGSAADKKSKESKTTKKTKESKTTKKTTKNNNNMTKGRGYVPAVGHYNSEGKFVQGLDPKRYPTI